MTGRGGVEVVGGGEMEIGGGREEEEVGEVEKAYEVHLWEKE
jgi:hypothetical protein